MAEQISIREYGRRKGISDTYIRRMIADGVITQRSVVFDPRNHRPAILFELAEEDWSANYSARLISPGSVRQSKKPNAPVNPKRVKRTQEEEEYEATDLQPSGNLDSGRPAGTLPDGRKSKAEIDRMNAEVKLQLSALALKQKKGELVMKKDVYASLFAMGQELRQSLLTLPDRLVDDILSAPDRNTAHLMAQEAIAKELEKLASMNDRNIA